MFYEKVPIIENELFVFQTVEDYSIDYPYHYHHEYEIIFISHASGSRFIGDKIGGFENYDLAFLGPNLPHKWKFEKTSAKSRIIVIKFKDALVNNPLFKVSGTEKINQFFSNAQYGLICKDSKTILEFKPVLDRLVSQTGIRAALSLIELCYDFSLCDKWKKETTITYNLQLSTQNFKIIDEVYNFILSNFTESLSLEEVARKFNYSKSGFFQFFRKHTGQNFSAFLLHLRISEACKLMVQTHLNVNEICYKCGFNNLSYFNRKFKQINGCSPSEYKKLVE
jgi:AraC-like DNA-binding protein